MKYLLWNTAMWGWHRSAEEGIKFITSHLDLAGRFEVGEAVAFAAGHAGTVVFPDCEGAIKERGVQAFLKLQVEAGNTGLPALPPFLYKLAERLRTQDNQCTANPMFCVMEEVTVYGMDPQWSDTELWIDISDGAHEVPAPEDGEETETVIKSGKHTYKKVVMVAFTEEGARGYLKQNGHNHRGKTSIYVESFNRCPEMIALREWLLSLGVGVPHLSSSAKEDSVPALG
jgi:hypothetical protein